MNWHKFFLFGSRRPRPIGELSTNLPLGSDFVYDTCMNKTLSKTDFEIVRSFFTDEEWDAIDSALADFQDYGDRETELMNSIGQKMTMMFQSRYQDENRHPDSGAN